MLFVIILNESEHVGATGGIQTGHGLVQHHDFGLHGKNARQRHTALLATRKLKGRLVQNLFGQAHDAAVLPNPAVNLILVQAHVLGAEGHVGIDRLLEQLVFGVLEHQTHGKPGRPGHLLGLEDVLAVDIDMARVGLEKSVEMLDEGGLSAAGVADEAHKLAPLDGKGHVIHRLFFKRRSWAVNMGKMFYA